MSKKIEIKNKENGWKSPFLSKETYALNYGAIAECAAIEKISSGLMADILGMPRTKFSVYLNSQCLIPDKVRDDKNIQIINDTLKTVINIKAWTCIKYFWGNDTDSAKIDAQLMKDSRRLYDFLNRNKDKQNITFIKQYIIKGFKQNIWDEFKKYTTQQLSVTDEIFDEHFNIYAECLLKTYNKIKPKQYSQTPGNRMLAEFGPAALSDLKKFFQHVMKITNEEMTKNIRYFLYVVIHEQEAIPENIRDDMYIAFRAHAETIGEGFPERGSVKLPTIRIKNKQSHMCFVCGVRMFLEWAGFPNCTTHKGNVFNKFEITKDNYSNITIFPDCNDGCTNHNYSQKHSTIIKSSKKWTEYKYHGLKDAVNFNELLKKQIETPPIVFDTESFYTDLKSNEESAKMILNGYVEKAVKDYLPQFIVSQLNQIMDEYPYGYYDFHFTGRKNLPGLSDEEQEKRKRLYFRLLFGEIARVLQKGRVNEYLYLMEYTYGYNAKNKMLDEFVKEQKKQYESDIGGEIEQDKIRDLSYLLGCSVGYIIGTSDNMDCGYTVNQFLLHDIRNPIRYYKNEIINKRSKELKALCPEIIEELVEIFTSTTVDQRKQIVEAAKETKRKIKNTAE